ISANAEALDPAGSGCLAGLDRARARLGIPGRRGHTVLEIRRAHQKLGASRRTAAPLARAAAWPNKRNFRIASRCDRGPPDRQDKAWSIARPPQRPPDRDAIRCKLFPDAAQPDASIQDRAPAGIHSATRAAPQCSGRSPRETSPENTPRWVGWA